MAKNMFSQKLNDAVIAKNSRLCVGLDPRLTSLPTVIVEKAVSEFGQTPMAAAKAIYHFNRQVLETVRDYAICVKPQIAFYELYGAAGIQAFWDTVDYAHELGLLVIADAKRGDIDSTAQAYANTYLGGDQLFAQTQTTNIDALTINPFLGEDTLQPFITTAKEQGKGLFVLVKTSNSGSGDLQDLIVNQESISLRLAQMLSHYDQPVDTYGYGLVGAVVGATYPQLAKQFRAALPHSLILVPGIGAQGGDPQLLQNFFHQGGLGAIVNSSRGITATFAPTDPNYLPTIAQAAQKTRDLINYNLA